jgi:hypothetical protein
MLKGKADGYSWEATLELLSKPAKLCEECFHFNILEVDGIDIKKDKEDAKNFDG